MIRLEVVNDEARIHIIDTGKGIEEDRIDEIFHPYVSSKRGGTGLGLANNNANRARTRWDTFK